LESLDVPIYKIASFENTHLPLIKKVAATGKPMIISTGMATISELDETVCTIRETGCEQFVLLKCTSTYPASPENSNVLTIPHMRELFGCEVGLSDHTMGVGTAVTAVAHGATVIEKHFTLCRDDGGVDSAFSLEPEEMKQLVIETGRAWQSLGKVTYGSTESEKSSLVFRRSLYIAEDIKKGDVLNEKNLRIVRPGMGLPPKYYSLLLGKKVNRDIKKGTALKFDHLLDKELKD
jgi:N-acetylneuraminate synthase